MTEASTAIDTVLVAYRSEDVIEAALARAARLGGRAVVVDHGDGASARIAARAGATAIHDPSNPGFGTGQNRGISFTGSELVLLCNPDAEIVPGAVLAGAALLCARPEAAAVQGVIVNRSTGRPERSAGVEVGPLHLLGRALGARRSLRVPGVAALARRSATLRDHADRVPSGVVEVESLAATALLVRRAALDQVGGFDERFFLYGEDLDLCRRLRLNGWALLATGERWAVHESGGSARSAVSREAEWWRGTMSFAARWWAPGAWRAALAAATLRWATLALSHPSRAGSTLQAVVVGPARTRHAGRAGR